MVSHCVGAAWALRCIVGTPSPQIGSIILIRNKSMTLLSWARSLWYQIQA